MSHEVQGAIVGGAISGGVVFAALAIERTLSRRSAERQRRQIAVSDALRIYLTAMAENVRAGDVATTHRAGAELLGATGQLAVLGPPELLDALTAFNRTGRQMGSPESQAALLEVLRAIRREVLPREPILSDETLRDLLFAKPAV